MPASPNGVEKGVRRTNVWTLLILLMAIGGMSLALPGTTSMRANAPLSAHSAPLPNFLWNPLTITSITSSANPAFVSNATTISVTATGGQPFTSPAGYTYSYAGLPTGCTSSNASSVVCTPTAVGNFTVIVTVSDAGGNVTKNAISLRVQGMTITSFTELPASVPLGSAATFAANYAGESGNVTWTWTGLPTGCASANAKTMSCTSTVSGTFSVTLKGTDASNASNSKSVSFTVTPVRVSTFTDSPNTIYTGQSTTFTVTTAGTTSAVSYAYSGLPTASPTCVSANTASLSCLARVAGTFSVKVTVTDTAGDISSATVTLTVKPLTITAFTVAPSPTYEFFPTTFTVTTFGYEGVLVAGLPTAGYPIYSYSGLPTGCLSSNTSHLVCSASQQGSFTVTVTVSDPTANSTSKTLSLLINPAVQPNLYVAMNSTIEQLPTSASICATTNNAPFYSSTCYPQAQDPSVVPLPNQITGLGYGLYTTSTNNTCLGAIAATNARVAFSLSKNNGTTFYNTVMLGGVTCQYLNAIEPSFGANAAGDVYGVFILENSTSTPNLYGARAGDALGFVSSLSGGVTFSSVAMLDVSGNLARPAIAVSGSDIYIVYETIANSSTAIPGGVLPIALKFIASTNGGTTWSAPITLPGENKTSDWNAMSPSITVSSTGEVAIAYATDRSCVAWAGSPGKSSCLHYGSQVVVITSITNGATWSGISVASAGVLTNPVTNTTGSFLGETTCYAGVCQPFFFQSSPSTSVSFNPTGTKLFVGWSGTVNNTATVLTSLWWRWSAVGVSGTINNGATWTGTMVAAPNWGSSLGGTAQTGNRSNYYRPAIGVIGSTLYLSYTEDNETNTTSGIGRLYPGPWDNGFSQWANSAAIASASAALTWGAAAPITWTNVPAGRLTNFTGNSFTGYASSLAFTSYGVPLIGYALAQNPTSTVVSRTGYYSQNYTYATSLTVAALGQPGYSQVIGLTILESGLPAGASWSIQLDYQVITSNATSILVVNVPKGITVFQKLLPFSGGNTWGELIAQTTVPATATYNVPSTMTLVYSILVYYNETQAPAFGPSTVTSSCNPATTYCYWYWYSIHYVYECIPVVGYTCSTAPANTAPSGYQSECGYSYQVGCYYLDFYTYNDTEYGPNYVYKYMYTEEYLYTYTLAQGYHEAAYLYDYCYSYNNGGTCTSYSPGSLCSSTSPLSAIGITCAVGSQVGIWLPAGFTIAPEEEYYYTNFVSGAPNLPNYFNGTGINAYDGKLVSTCLSVSSCPEAYYIYYYYALYDPSYCYYNSPNDLCSGGGPITIVGPVNETMWNLPGSVSTGGSIPGYPIEVEPKGLPSGTAYSFDLGSTLYKATSPNAVLVSSVPPGYTTITNGSAPGSPAGWEYYAPPLSVTIPTDVIVNLTFSTLVNLSAPSRAISIHALNLTTGIGWASQFNGTIYTSSIPWINVSARPGYYSVESWAVNSTAGDTEFAPLNPLSANFATHTQYNLSFQPSYRVGTTSSQGGTIQLGAGKPGSGTAQFYRSGATTTVTATPAAGYEFLGFTGVGAGSYTGNGTHVGSQFTATLTVNGPLEEGSAFGLMPAARYNITFVSKDLPKGVWWTVSLDGVEYSTAASAMTVTGLYVHNAPGGIGTYKFAVGNAYENGTNGTRYIPGGFPSNVWANASGVTTYAITWATQYQVTLAATPGGSVTGSAGTLRVAAGSFWESANSTVAAIATKEPGYRFLGWNGTGTGSVTNTAASIQFQITGSVTEVALFEQIPYHAPPQYVVNFVLTTPVEAGTTWTLTVANTTASWQFSSVTGSLNATGLNNGTYTLKTAIAYGPDGLTRYVAVAPPPTVTVAGQNATQRLSYSTEYWVSVEASALGSVSVTQGSSNAAASLSGWYTARTVLVLTANATGNDLFVGWIGNGSASYTGTQPSQTITVTGPVREVAEFEPPAPATKENGGFFSTTPSWIVLAAVGFAVGMVLGIVMFRRRRGGSDEQEHRHRDQPTMSDVTSEPSDGSWGGEADREASAPSVSELTESPGADQ